MLSQTVTVCPTQSIYSGFKVGGTGLAVPAWGIQPVTGRAISGSRFQPRFVAQTLLLPIRPVSRNNAFQPGEQRTQGLFVVLPSSHRSPEDRLSYLDGAGRSHHPCGTMKLQTSRLPFQTAPAHEASGRAFQISDSLFVVHFPRPLIIGLTE